MKHRPVFGNKFQVPRPRRQNSKANTQTPKKLHSIRAINARPDLRIYSSFLLLSPCSQLPFSPSPMPSKLRFVAATFFAILFAVSLRAEGYSSRESFSQTGRFSPTGKVILENINGDVDIHTWDRNEILIEGEKSARTDEELKLIDLTIDLKESNAVIKVRLPKREGFFSNNIRASVSFKITVPATVSLDKIAVVNSSVRIKDMRGPVNAESVNGGVHAHNLAGNVKLQTVNGEIVAEVSSVASDQKLSFQTVNGSVTVKLPADTGADTHASVVNGSITCDFPLTVQGRVSGKHLSGKIGDGRASLSAESVNGSIRFKKLAGSE